MYKFHCLQMLWKPTKEVFMKPPEYSLSFWNTYQNLGNLSLNLAQVIMFYLSLVQHCGIKYLKKLKEQLIHSILILSLIWLCLLILPLPLLLLLSQFLLLLIPLLFFCFDVEYYSFWSNLIKLLLFWGIMIKIKRFLLVLNYPCHMQPIICEFSCQP